MRHKVFLNEEPLFKTNYFQFPHIYFEKRNFLMTHHFYRNNIRTTPIFDILTGST